MPAAHHTVPHDVDDYHDQHDNDGTDHHHDDDTAHHDDDGACSP